MSKEEAVSILLAEQAKMELNDVDASNFIFALQIAINELEKAIKIEKGDVDRNQKYRIRREGVTFIGNLDKDDIVRIIHINSLNNTALIDNGYAQDEICLKELERL